MTCCLWHRQATAKVTCCLWHWQATAKLTCCLWHCHDCGMACSCGKSPMSVQAIAFPHVLSFSSCECVGECAWHHMSSVLFSLGNNLNMKLYCVSLVQANNSSQWPCCLRTQHQSIPSELPQLCYQVVIHNPVNFPNSAIMLSFTTW